MGQLVNVTRNQEVLQGFQIESSLDMHTVLNWAKGKGYTGNINLDASGRYTLGLTGPNGDSQNCTIGAWAILKNDIAVTLVPESQAGSLYTIVP